MNNYYQSNSQEDSQSILEEVSGGSSLTIGVSRYVTYNFIYYRISTPLFPGQNGHVH